MCARGLEEVGGIVLDRCYVFDIHWSLADMIHNLLWLALAHNVPLSPRAVLESTTSLCDSGYTVSIIRSRIFVGVYSTIRSSLLNISKISSTMPTHSIHAFSRRRTCWSTKVAGLNCWNIHHVTRSYQTTVHMVCAL